MLLGPAIVEALDLQDFWAFSRPHAHLPRPCRASAAALQMNSIVD
jgi:hypothetical protein